MTRREYGLHGGAGIIKGHTAEKDALRSLIEEVRAMRPSTDVNRLSLSREHRENEIGRLAYRRAINDVLDRIATRVIPPEESA